MLATKWHIPSNNLNLTGHVYEFGTPEYEEYLPSSKRQPGSRAVIVIDVLKVGTVGYTFSYLPFVEYPH